MFFDEIVLALTAVLQAWTAKELRAVRKENQAIADQAHDDHRPRALRNMRTRRDDP